MLKRIYRTVVPNRGNIDVAIHRVILKNEPFLIWRDPGEKLKIIVNDTNGTIGERVFLIETKHGSLLVNSLIGYSIKSLYKVTLCPLLIPSKVLSNEEIEPYLISKEKRKTIFDNKSTFKPKKKVRMITTARSHNAISVYLCDVNSEYVYSFGSKQSLIDHLQISKYQFSELLDTGKLVHKDGSSFTICSEVE